MGFHRSTFCHMNTKILYFNKISMCNCLHYKNILKLCPMCSCTSLLADISKDIIKEMELNLKKGLPMGLFCSFIDVCSILKDQASSNSSWVNMAHILTWHNMKFVFLLSSLSSIFITLIPLIEKYIMDFIYHAWTLSIMVA